MSRCLDCARSTYAVIDEDKDHPYVHCDYHDQAVDADFCCDYYQDEDIVGDEVDDDLVSVLYDPAYCYECGGYGDDYYYDEDGDLIISCDNCPFSPYREEEY